MLPIIVQSDTAVGLAGADAGLARRKAVLVAAGISPVQISPEDKLPSGLKLLFIAGLPREQSKALAARAKAAGVLVNVEDVPALCDFHVPAMVRRGDLLISISTAGRAPGLAKLIREWIERRLGLEWRGHLDDVAAARSDWRDSGLGPAEVSRRTRKLVRDRELLP